MALSKIWVFFKCKLIEDTQAKIHYKHTISKIKTSPNIFDQRWKICIRCTNNSDDCTSTVSKGEKWTHAGHCSTTAALAVKGDTLSTLDL